MAVSDINKRKRRKVMVYDPAQHSVMRSGTEAPLTVQLTDPTEPDRRVGLDLTDEDAVRLAARIAHHLGMRLVVEAQ